MSGTLRALLVEDDASDAGLVLQVLRRAGHEVHALRVETEADLRRALHDEPWDVVISDWSLPKYDGLSALRLVRATCPSVPFVIVSGTMGEEFAVEAMRAGADDFVTKGRLTRLAPAIERGQRDREARAQAEEALRVSESGRARAEASLRDREEQLQTAQKMEAVGLLAGGIAHDFNNLLSVILSYSTFALDDLPPGALRDDLAEIHAAAERAAALTRQLLAFSRRQVLRPRVVDLDEVLSGLERMLVRTIGEDIELRRVTEPGLPPIRVDPGQLEQVVVNLAVNARDAMPRGGTLLLSTTFAADVGMVRLTVADTGHGMDEATLARAFEPFFTTKPVGAGTGLGLATAFGIVKQSGGSIRARSAVGVGTTFDVDFPPADGATDRPVLRTPGGAGVRGDETLLVVEDEESVRSVVCRILRGQGYDVLEAESGAEALTLCEQHAERIRVLVTDVVMPRMSGRELAERVTTLLPGVRVLYLSGHADDAVVRHGVLQEGTEFLEKPIRPEVLIRKVREVLDAPGITG